jgi:hypothetical protein
MSIQSKYLTLSFPILTHPLFSTGSDLRPFRSIAPIVYVRSIHPALIAVPRSLQYRPPALFVQSLITNVSCFLTVTNRNSLELRLALS